MVIIKERSHRYSSKQSFIHGRGYVENIGTNDLIMKVVTNLAVAGLAEGSKQLLSKILNKREQKELSNETNGKSKRLLEEIIGTSQTVNPVTNIIGSGARGCIKKF
jgi:hypothetical protein